MSKHEKLYKNVDEEKLRFSIFQENLRKIEEHNEKYRAGNATFYKAVNKFADLSKEEFSAFLKRQSAGRPKLDTVYRKPNAIAVPDAYDWRDRGAVSKVKNQASCGSCWAFSATGALESAYYLKYNQMVLFSEQQLVDCDTNQGGCAGGDEGVALYYIKNTGGLQLEDTYPYESRDGSCRYEQSKLFSVPIREIVQLQSKNENELLQAIGSIQPVTVALDASDLGSYGGGVMSNGDCTRNELNHAVLGVGYGHDSETGLDYWILKNSWSDDFGENGYFRIRRGTDECGISTENLYPVLD